MYELLFWQYADEIYLNHHIVYEKLCDGEIIEGLENLPISVILNRIENVFSDWDKVDDNSWKSSRGIGAFQVKSTAQSIKIDCYGTDGKSMDRIVSVLNEFKCPLYDPQIPARYDAFFE